MGMYCHFVSLDSAALKNLEDNPALTGEYAGFRAITDKSKNYLDLNKSWHGIHFLLSGEVGPGTEPISWAVLGGAPIGEDVGYGPARILTPEQLKLVSKSFEEIDLEKFRKKFDPRLMDRDIYPGGTWVKEGDEGLEYLVEYYKKLVLFYRAAAGRNDGMLIWLS